MKLTTSLPVRLGMAVWEALLALEMFAFASIILDYKLGLGIFKIDPYPRNVPLWDVTPLWEPVLAFGMGLGFLCAIVLILRRSRIAFWVTLGPLVLIPLLFTGRIKLAVADIQQNLVPIYSKHPVQVVLPVMGIAITILICVVLWQDNRDMRNRDRFGTP